MNLRGLPLMLARYLRQADCWEAKNALTTMIWDYEDKTGRRYGAAVVDRKLRELETKRILAVKYEGGHAFYHYISEPMRKRYVPTSERSPGHENEIWRGTVINSIPRARMELVERNGMRVMRIITQ